MKTNQTGKDLWPGMEKFLKQCDRFDTFLGGDEPPTPCNLHIGFTEHGYDVPLELDSHEARGVVKLIRLYLDTKRRNGFSGPGFTLYLKEGKQ